MSDRQISIAVDAMGGENSPYKVLKELKYFKKIITKHLLIYLVVKI